jgi:hypothetical protein
LFGVLGTFNVLFQGAFKAVPVGNADASMLFAKVVIQPDYDIFIIWVSFDLVVWLTGEGIGTIRSPRLIFEYDVVLLPLREVSCNAWSNFAGVTVVSEVCMVSVDYDRDRSPFE